MKRIDVIFLLNYELTGGAELNALLLAEGFSQAGYSAEVVFCFRRERLNGAPVSMTTLSDALPRSLRGVLQLIVGLHRLRRKRPRAIVGFQSFSNVVGSLLSASVPGCRFVGTQRSPANTGGRIAALLDRIAGSTRLYASNICVSEAVRESYSGFPVAYRARLKTIRNGTPALPRLAESKAESRRRLGLPEAGPVMGFIGRIAPPKNVLFLLDIAAQTQGVALAVVGDGPLRDAFSDRIIAMGLEAQVHMIGRLQGADVSRFYNAIDLCLIPSFYEGFCRTLVEAMSVGVPTICSDLDVFREVGADAALVTPLDAGLWAAKVEALMADPARRAALGEAGIARSKQHSTGAMIARYMQECGLG